MKKLIISSILALSLAGCAGSSVPSTDTITTRAKQIQSYTKLACSFIPTIATVAAILSKGASSSVASVATDICNAITTAPLADGGGRLAYVNGVRIHGQFVK